MWNNGYVERDSEIKRMFDEEVRDKKRTGYGGFHNVTHRGGGKKGARLKTQVDFLTGKAKREYTKGGIIMTSNIYQDINNIPSLDIIATKDHDLAYTIVKAAKQYHTAKVLGLHWGKSGGSIYGIYDKYGVEYEKRPRKNKKENKKDDKSYLKAPAYEPKVKEKNEVVLNNEIKSLLEENKEYKAHMEFKEELAYQALLKNEIPVTTFIPEEEEEQKETKYIVKNQSGKEVQERIMSLMSILYLESRYKIKLIITELPDSDK